MMKIVMNDPLPLDIKEKMQELKELCSRRGYDIQFKVEVIEYDFWELFNDKYKKTTN